MHLKRLCLSTSMKLIVSVVDKDSVCQQDGMIFFSQGIPISLKKKLSTLAIARCLFFEDAFCLGITGIKFILMPYNRMPFQDL